ncbi:MAG: MATE family efflux transporter, partial [Lachnospiraceae bacterium]|nr:MATE family efflux transporter [Lachnospiraceae bacterium]
MSNIKEKYSNFVAERPERIELYKSLATLVIPMAVQNLLAALVNSVDILMLGYVGQDELSAVSLANQYMFILWGFFFGINSAETLMNSQYWGKGDKRAIQAILGIAFKISLVVTGIVSVACVFFPKNLMGLYTNDATLINIGTDYLRTIGISYVLMSFSQAYQCTLRSIEKATKSTVISTITLVLNVCLNAIFIFGLFGAPKLGVIGVAIATTISRIIELVICLIDYLFGKDFKASFKLLFGHHKVLLNDFIKYACPALVNDLAWTLAFSSYSIILGHMNNDIVAASSVATTIRDLFTTVCYGLASGGTVIIGKELGCSNLKKAKKDSVILTFMVVILTACLGIVLVLMRHPLMSFFTLNERTYGY